MRTINADNERSLFYGTVCEENSYSVGICFDINDTGIGSYSSLSLR